MSPRATKIRALHATRPKIPRFLETILAQNKGLVKGGSVAMHLEGRPRSKVDAIGQAAVEGAIGLVVKSALTHLMQNLLLGVTPLDAVSFVAAPFVLGNGAHDKARPTQDAACGQP